MVDFTFTGSTDGTDTTGFESLTGIDRYDGGYSYYSDGGPDGQGRLVFVGAKNADGTHGAALDIADAGTGAQWVTGVENGSHFKATGMHIPSAFTITGIKGGQPNALIASIMQNLLSGDDTFHIAGVMSSAWGDYQQTPVANMHLGDDYFQFDSGMTLAPGSTSVVVYGDAQTASAGTIGGSDIISGQPSTVALTLYGDFGSTSGVVTYGNDSLIGGSQGDTIYGDSPSAVTAGGNDYLRGGGGNDSLFGEGGNDYLVGGPGADVLDGGDGFDFAAYNGDTTPIVTMIVDLENNSLNTGLATGDTLISIEGIVATDFGGVIVNDLRGDENANTLISLSGYDILTGRGGNDTLKAGTGDDTLDGGNGADLLVFSAQDLTSDDIVNGGTDASIDSLMFNTSGTIPFTAYQNVSHVEQIVLANGNNNTALTNALVSSADDNHMFYVTGGTGNDRVDASAIVTATNRVFFTAGAGNDTLIGGAGADTFYFTAANFTAADSVNGGAGGSLDRLVFTTAGTVPFTAYQNLTHIEQIVLANGTNDTALTNAMVASADDNHVLTVTGGTGNDTVNGSAVTTVANRIVFNGGGGADVFTAGAGADIFTYAAASDSTSTAYDTITGFNSAADRFDVPGRAGSITLVEGARTGALDGGTNFNTELAARFSTLAGHHAGLLTATSGTLSGQTFLVVDLNGTTGYQAGADLVLHLASTTGTLVAGDFV